MALKKMPMVATFVDVLNHPQSTVQSGQCVRCIASMDSKKVQMAVTYAAVPSRQQWHLLIVPGEPFAESIVSMGSRRVLTAATYASAMTDVA
jgi:hypothetical protein